MYYQRFKSLEERFWEKVEKTDSCWNWTAGCGSKGYGSFRLPIEYNSKPVASSIAAWLIYYGELPKLWVLHTCDNRKCVRKEHLYLGTVKENGRDAAIRNRMLSGDAHPTRTQPEAYMKNKARHERHNKAKLTMVKAEEIRNRYLEGNISQTKLATEYGVVQSVISSILKDKTWIYRDQNE